MLYNLKIFNNSNLKKRLINLSLLINFENIFEFYSIFMSNKYLNFKSILLLINNIKIKKLKINI